MSEATPGVGESPATDTDPSAAFRARVAAALEDAPLQRALLHMRDGFVERRRIAVEALPEFDALRDRAVEIKDHVLANLDLYLETFERRVVAAGGTVHWADTAEAAREAVLGICRLVGARTATKGKSMIGEEIGLNAYLEANDVIPVETDLGEYVIQLRGETPSHIIAPAIHVSPMQVADTFRMAHRTLSCSRKLNDIAALQAEARSVMRRHFIEADVGITGANFLVAETGSAVIVTNEGNGDLTQTLPRIHIVLASIEKIVPTLEDAACLLRVLARSATGQEASVYTTFSTGPAGAGDLDGPEQFHVVLIDNGRSALVGSEFEEVLRCIRCGACLNHCPVYGAIGGHAYGTVYPGPLGKALMPALDGLAATADLPHASTFCGRCEEVCPMRIPLPKIMRHWRERAFRDRRGGARGERGRARQRALRVWALAARLPPVYRLGMWLGRAWLRRRARGEGWLTRLPFAPDWTRYRDLPVPEAETLRTLWAARDRARALSAGSGPGSGPTTNPGPAPGAE